MHSVIDQWGLHVRLLDLLHVQLINWIRSFELTRLLCLSINRQLTTFVFFFSSDRIKIEKFKNIYFKYFFFLNKTLHWGNMEPFGIRACKGNYTQCYISVRACLRPNLNSGLTKRPLEWRRGWITTLNEFIFGFYTCLSQTWPQCWFNQSF